MATVRILLAFVCFAAAGEYPLLGRNLLNLPSVPLVVSLAQQELGTREATGNNDGVKINAYQAAAGLKTGAPWCAAFVSWLHQKAGYPQPKTGWSPALFPKAKIRKIPEPGMVFGIYFDQLKRIAHCGIVERVQDGWIVTVEGNTNVQGSREGDGVYRKWRPQRTVRAYADWRGQ